METFPLGNWNIFIILFGNLEILSFSYMQMLRSESKIEYNKFFKCILYTVRPSYYLVAT